MAGKEILGQGKVFNLYSPLSVYTEKATSFRRAPAGWGSSTSAAKVLARPEGSCKRPILGKEPGTKALCATRQDCWRPQKEHIPSQTSGSNFLEAQFNVIT